MIEIEILGAAPPGARNILPAALPRLHPEVIHPGQVDVLGNSRKRSARRRPVRIDTEERRGDPGVGAVPGCNYNAHVPQFVGNTVRHVLDDVELDHSKSPPLLKKIWVTQNRATRTALASSTASRPTRPDRPHGWG